MHDLVTIRHLNQTAADWQRLKAERQAATEAAEAETRAAYERARADLEACRKGVK